MPEAAPVEEVPNVEPSVDSFLDSAGSELEAAFAALEAEETPKQEPEATEPKQEPEATEPKQEPEATEPKSEDQPAEPKEHDPTTELELDEAELKDWTPKAADAFKRYKGENKQLRATAEQLELKIKSYEEKIKAIAGANDEEALTQLQERLENYERTMAATNLEQTTAYKEAITDPLNKLFEDGVKLGAAHEVTREQMLALFQASPREQETMVKELMPESTERERATLFRLFDEVDPILDRKAQMKANAQEAMKEAQALEETRAAEAAAQAAEQRKVNANTIVERMNQRIPFLAELEGYDADAVKEAVAEKDPTNIHPVDFSYFAASAQLMPTLIRAFRQQQLELESVTDQLADIKGSTPGLAEGSEAAPTKPTSKDSDGGYAETIDKAFQDLGLSR